MTLAEVINAFPYTGEEAKYLHKGRVKVNGKYKVMRFFVSAGALCVALPRSRRRGRYLSTYMTKDWESVKFLPTTQDVDFDKLLRRVRRRVNDTCAMLEGNGFWPYFLEDFKRFKALDDDALMEFVKDSYEDYYNKVWCQIGEGLKYGWIQNRCDMWERLIMDKWWHTPRFHKGDWYGSKKDAIKAFEDNASVHRKWRNGYDCSLEVACEEGKPKRAWYSEEYRNCANGWYYLLFDATHAVFYEKD